MSYKCPIIKPPKFSISCKPVVNSQVIDNVYYNPETNEVFDKEEKHMGYGTLDSDGEFLTLEIMCGYKFKK